MSAPTVAVIGGGLAGISAALECASQGVRVTLLESRGRLGGAAFSFARDGLSLDNGQHVFLRCCTAYQEFLQRIGAAEMVTLQERLRIAVLGPGGKRALLARGGLPAPLHLAGSLLRYPFLSVRQRLSVALTMQALRGLDPDDPALDSRAFGDWLTERHQDGAPLDALWDLIARPTINLAPADASLAQAAQVFQLGVLAQADAGDVGYARVPLSEIHDVAARRALAEAGVAVSLRSGVSAITPGSVAARSTAADGGSTDVPRTPGFTVSTRQGQLETDVVILAVQPSRAARLLPADSGVQVDALNSLGSSPIVNLHIVYDRTVLDEPFAAGVGTPVQWIFDRTRSSGVEDGQCVAVSLSAADEELAMTSEQLQARYLPAMASLLPAARGARVKGFFVTREHAATFRAAPGARRLRPETRTEIPGLLLAGTWTDTGWPATMEGAVRSGLAAARAAVLEGEQHQSLLSVGGA